MTEVASSHMQEPLERTTPLAWELLFALVSTLLLSLGFLGYVYLASVVASHNLVEAQAIGRMQEVLVVYARTLLVKGLLPQLAIALLLWVPLDRLLSSRLISSRAPGGLSKLILIVGIFVCAAVGNAIVVPTLLLVEHPGMPAVKFTGTWNVVRTFLEMTSAVAAAALLPRLLHRRYARRAIRADA